MKPGGRKDFLFTVQPRRGWIEKPIIFLLINYSTPSLRCCSMQDYKNERKVSLKRPTAKQENLTIEFISAIANYLFLSSWTGDLQQLIIVSKSSEGSRGDIFRNAICFFNCTSTRFLTGLPHDTILLGTSRSGWKKNETLATSTGPSAVRHDDTELLMRMLPPSFHFGGQKQDDEERAIILQSQNL